jgi:hypothetical protein
MLASCKGAWHLYNRPAPAHDASPASGAGEM